MKSRPNFIGHCVNRLTLSAAIFMIDPISLIMALDEAGSHQFGNRAADRRQTGFPDPFADMGIYHSVSSGRIGRQLAAGSKRSPNLFPSCTSLVMTRCARGDGDSEPFPYGYQGVTFANQWTGLPVRAGNPCNEVEHHKGIARPSGMFRNGANHIG